MQLRHELGERAELVGELQVAALFPGDHLEGIAAELLRQAVEVAAEDRAQHDLERELAHLVGEVHRLAARGELIPAREAPFVGRGDQLRELGDDAAVEQRLHHVALALPQLPFAGHDALAEEDLDPVEPDALGVVPVVADQHPLHVVRVVDHIGIRFACRNEHAIGVAVAGEQLDHALQRIVGGADVELRLGFGGQGVRGRGGGHASC